MIFCNPGPIAAAWYIYFLKYISYLGKEVVSSAHAAFIKGV